jgi:hypothetical protein
MAQGWRARYRVPGPRPHYHAHYYGAFVLDPDGHRIKAVCHTPMSPAIVATGLRRAERNPSSDIRHTVVALARIAESLDRMLADPFCWCALQSTAARLRRPLSSRQCSMSNGVASARSASCVSYRSTAAVA